MVKINNTSRCQRLKEICYHKLFNAPVKQSRSTSTHSISFRLNSYGVVRMQAIMLFTDFSDLGRLKLSTGRILQLEPSSFLEAVVDCKSLIFYGT